MSINLVIAVTDGDWYETLRQQPDLDEVNFWAPSATNFHSLKPGELFLFKLRGKNAIAGGGIFYHANLMPCSMAWRMFGTANGAWNEEELRDRIVRLSRRDTNDPSDFNIGCRILTQPFFFEESDWITPPSVWHRNTQNYAGFNTDNEEILALWNTLKDYLQDLSIIDPAENKQRFGVPRLIIPRLGQGAFRTKVLDTYKRRCAITEERTLPALEVAHIRPYSRDGKHEVKNGLLLRRDIHTLFDLGYVTVTPELRFEVSRRIREEFSNGRHYYALQGQEISVPEDTSLRPDPAELIWHNDNRFQG